ncbi:MAG: SDR family NAD(P)-dependent oxidoreductase [Steroidobacteraceae bacterium]
MKANTDLTDRVAVITGAARGIGLALALHAADRGMRLALADEDEHALIAAVEQVRAKNVEAISIHGDMLVFDAVRELARHSAAELGPPWLVCNNPGVNIHVNLWGVIHGVQVFAPDMVKRGEGHIVNIAAAELFGTRGAAPYLAATHAIVGLSEELYRELDSMGSMVGVTVVCPETADTNITDTLGYREAGGRVMRDLPLNSLTPQATAEEIFDAVDTRRFRVYAARQLHGMFGSDPSSGATSYSANSVTQPWASQWC